MRRIFLDANIPIYAAGRDHPLKAPCSHILRLAADHPERFLTDAEVAQELLHFYLARGTILQGVEVVLAFTTLLAGRIEPVRAEDVVLACHLAVERGAGLSARDLLHAAVMRRLGVTHIISADRGFDRLPFLHRLDPATLETWSDLLRS
jgi:predicted nucleic acid-binding protein